MVICVSMLLCPYIPPSPAQTVKRLPTMWETQVQFLGREDPLEKQMAIHSITLAWKIPWMEKPDNLQSMGSQKSQTWLSYWACTHTYINKIHHKYFFPFCLRSHSFWQSFPLLPSRGLLGTLDTVTLMNISPGLGVRKIYSFLTI